MRGGLQREEVVYRGRRWFTEGGGGLQRRRRWFSDLVSKVTNICCCRGKCSVSLLNELEDIHTYLDKEDTFFFTMVYDPNQKTLLVDKGEIRVGTDYQAEISPFLDPGVK